MQTPIQPLPAEAEPGRAGASVSQGGPYRLEWHEVSVQGAHMRYAMAGEGPPVVLLHGLSCSHEWWSRNMPALAEEFRVYAVDLLAQSRGNRTDFGLKDAATQLRAWMIAVGLERASFIGHSMGGYIAADLAAQNPEAVEKLVLASAALFPERGFPFSLKRLRRLSRLIPLPLAPLLVRNAWRTGFGTVFRFAWALLRGNLRTKLACVHAPALLLWGEQDALLPLRVARELHLKLPVSQLHVLRNAAHSPMWEAPDAFNAAVLRFLHEPLPVSQ